MNKKQKILTVVALAVFGAIIFLHYYNPLEPQLYDKVFGIATLNHYTHPAIYDVHMPLFVLGVFYAGLFFILRDARPGR